ncbi:MAG TPA: L,D-transpeptidase [Actinomycetota bacterium]
MIARIAVLATVGMLLTAGSAFHAAGGSVGRDAPAVAEAFPDWPRSLAERPPRPRAPEPVVRRVNPLKSHARGKLIEVSIDRQRLKAWRNGRVILRLTISTGMPGWDTPTGVYRVYAKAVAGFSDPWQVVMPWMLAFNGNYTIHQVTHPPGYPDQVNGRESLGTPASHGCVRVDVNDAERLWSWASVGTPVWIH